MFPLTSSTDSKGEDLENNGVSYYSDDDDDEDSSSKSYGTHASEPIHGCFSRLLMCLLSLCSIATIAWAALEYILAPVQYVALLSTKCILCTYCCPPSVHRCFRNLAMTPLRWLRIALTGVGHIECWTHPAWPFRQWYQKTDSTS